MPKYLILSLLAITLIDKLSAQDTVAIKKNYVTAWAKAPVLIDGIMNDSVWSQVEWSGDFVGYSPEYNVAPSEETQFKILYDAKYLYVGIRAFDSDPSKIAQRMSRRDGFEGDFVEINIDSYHDKRTAFSFSASVSGVKGDEYISNNGDNWDSTWDPIWYLKTSIDEKGWIAEFKIPLSQLRFANQDQHTWGIQVTRRLFRKEERSTWQAIDPNAPGWVHLFGELKGIKGIKPQKQLEIQPYVVGRAQTYAKEEDNPFRSSGHQFDGNVGVDAKIGITSDITLDLTINPDFGQVEADPSTVNLSAFRLFFDEQRPFFLEGSNIMTFGTSGGINNLYYSRRIGGTPSGYPEDDDIDYVDQPNQTRILGAAKVTGKNAKGFSWGVLESITNREFAQVIDTLGEERREQVGAYTNYLVARVQQDYGGGKTVMGAYYSQMNRYGNNTNGLELLHDNARTAGLDIDHNFKKRKYGFGAKFVVSNVHGNKNAIIETQTASERYYQRTDNSYRNIDSTRTNLTGSAAHLTLGKRSGNWRWAIGSNYRSPGLELNDVGFLVQTDVINNWLWSRYQINKPTKLFRRQEYNLYAENILDFGGVQTLYGANFELSWQFKNLWEFGSGSWVQGTSVSNADLRGGPSISYPGGINLWYFFESNEQKKLSGGFYQRQYRGVHEFVLRNEIEFWMNYQPTNALSVSLNPSFSSRRNELQYIDQLTSSDETDYLMGTVDQRTYSLSFRANYNLTPNLTVEFWGQPFLAVGEYTEFKWAAQTNSENYDSRFAMIDPSTIQYYEVDEINDLDAYYEIDNNEDWQFDDPDFNTVEFRSNFVIRWEYIPGSTLFVVWSNNGSYYDQADSNRFNDLSNKLTGLDGTNTFLIKYTYRFLL